MSAKTIVILGAGVGGIIAANELRGRLSASHRIVLVERNAEHAFAPSFLWLMVGDRRPGQVRRPVRGLVGRGVELVQATACWKRARTWPGSPMGNFFAEPSPEVKMRQVGRAWHIGKVLFERWWLSPPGWKRTSYRTALKLGGRLWGIPITV